MLVFFWTDTLLWLMVIASILCVYKFSRRPDFHSLSKQLCQSNTVIICSVILLFYLLTALADSIHYKPRFQLLDNKHTALTNNSNGSSLATTDLSGTNYNSIRTFLDYLLSPLNNTNEITFSAPFASTLFAKDNIALPDGSEKFDYPALKYSKKIPITKLLFDILLRVLLSLFFVYAINLFIKKLITRKIYIFDLYKNTPIRTLYTSLFFTLSLLLTLLYLSKYYHIMGTDKIGRDVFYLTIKSVRTGILIGSLTTLFVLPLSIGFGTVAGYYSGKADDIIQYLYTTLSSIPGVLLISASILIIQSQIALHPHWFTTLEQQSDIRLLSLCFILSITSWSSLCRLIRAETLKIKQLDYVTAAKSMQVKSYRIITRHIIPNLMHIIILTVVLDFSGLILAEAVLSYIGVGVDATTISWGNMINSARSELSREPVIWWTIIAAFVPMFILVLTINLLSDKLRNVLEPRTRLR